MKPLGYVVTSRSIGHVSRYAIEGIEDAAGSLRLAAHHSPFNGGMARRLLRYLADAGGVRAIRRPAKRALLVPMMGLSERLFFPWTYTTEVIPIAFDCVPREFGAWEAVIRRNRVSVGFFTASMAAEHFRSRVPEGSWFWMPEAVDAGRYVPDLAWEDRTIDLLEFGRRHERFHDLVASGCRSRGHTHRFETTKGHLVFGDRAALAEGLSRSKISVCFPQSVTHPERFGGLETLTQRYLESMASGCVVLGQAPAELISLFGYDPVVAIDWRHPVDQIDDIIRRPELHAALRVRNLAAVRTAGSWTNRLEQVVSVLSEHGYVREFNCAYSATRRRP